MRHSFFEDAVNCLIRVIVLGVEIVALTAGMAPQKQTPSKAPAPQKQASDQRRFGQSYSTLRPEQKRLVDDFVRHYDSATESELTPEQAYDGARISVRTTFDAVTHALATTKLTNEQGKSLGRAIDLVEALDDVAGEEEGGGGDRQFRLYVYLTPPAVDTLSNSREFFRDKDNTVYHKGFPICFRLKKGPPSIQFSISRDMRMSDIDVDYRSSSFPKALFNGHLTAGNSDVRAGNNLETHDNRWAGLNGWWREVFGFSLAGDAKPKETETGRTRSIPLNPRVSADKGIDTSAHDFLKAWVVDKKTNSAVAYISRRSYPCLEEIARKRQKPVPPGMVRVRIVMGMDKFNESTNNVTSVADVFESAGSWSPELKEAKNAYASEFRLVNVSSDAAQDLECLPASDQGKKANEKFYATAFRGKQGDGRNKVMSLLWAQEGKYWKIVAIRIDDATTAGIVPTRAAAAPKAPEAEPAKFEGDPTAVKDITNFYQTWLVKRDTAAAASYASVLSYPCVSAPSSEAEKKMKPAARIQSGLGKPLPKIAKGSALSDVMSGVQPVNELVLPVDQKNSQALAIMAVPDEMAGSFLCQNRQDQQEMPELKPNDAKYGTYYMSASRLKYGEEESPALLMLWAKEKGNWKVIAWAIEVP